MTFISLTFGFRKFVAGLEDSGGRVRLEVLTLDRGVFEAEILIFIEVSFLACLSFQVGLVNVKLNFWTNDFHD